MKAVDPLPTINMHQMVLKKRGSNGEHKQNDGGGQGSPSRKHVSKGRQFHEKRVDKLEEEQVQERGLMAPRQRKEARAGARPARLKEQSKRWQGLCPMDSARLQTRNRTIAFSVSRLTTGSTQKLFRWKKKWEPREGLFSRNDKSVVYQ